MKLRGAFRRSYKTRLVLSYYPIFAVFIIAVCLLYYSLMSRSLMQREETNLRFLTQKTLEQVDAFFHSIDNLTLQCIASVDIRSLFGEADRSRLPGNYFIENFTANARMRNALLLVNGPLFTAWRLSVFNDRADFAAVGNLYPSQTLVVPQIARDADLPVLRALNGGKLIRGPHADPWSEFREEPIVSLSRLIAWDGKMLGYVETQQPFSRLRRLINATGQDSTPAYLVDADGLVYGGDGRVVASSDPAWQFVRSFEASLHGDRDVLRTLTNARGIAAYRSSSYSGWALMEYAPASSLAPPLRFLLWPMLLLLFGFGVPSLVTTYLISQRMSRPIHDLAARLQDVTVDTWSVGTREGEASDDVRVLSEAINGMLDKLKESNTELIDARTREVKASFSALQAQINPHFLYNLFATIGAAARAAHAPRIEEISLKASSLLRYLTKTEGESVSFDREWENARCYVDLMRHRFEDQLSVEWNVDASIRDLPVPKLFLQPLIENCYQHGFKGRKPPWRVNVTAMAGDDRWMVRIEDNGTGFPEDRRDAILREAARDGEIPSGLESDAAGGSGIGIVNICRRFRLIDPTFSFAAGPSVLGGACVVLTGQAVVRA